ncbi:MAG: hypothetical protein ACLPTF_12870 [Steroidobacteraceae bacterium]
MLTKHCLAIWSLPIALSFAASGVAMAGHGPVDFQVLRHIGGPALNGRSYQAINTRDDWVAYWNTTPDPMALPPPPVGGESPPRLPRPSAPEIDFSQSTLLIVSLGPSTGHSVFFADIREFDNRIDVRVFDMTPGRDCAFAQIVSYPSAVALIPHTLKTVHFILSQASFDCRNAEVVVSPSSHSE